MTIREPNARIFCLEIIRDLLACLVWILDKYVCLVHHKQQSENGSGDDLFRRPYDMHNRLYSTRPLKPIGCK